jgi:hypothetical protein
MIADDLLDGPTDMINRQLAVTYPDQLWTAGILFRQHLSQINALSREKLKPSGYCIINRILNIHE